jgi:hypothetical protein
MYGALTRNSRPALILAFSGCFFLLRYLLETSYASLASTDFGCFAGFYRLSDTSLASTDFGCFAGF